MSVSSEKHIPYKRRLKRSTLQMLLQLRRLFRWCVLALLIGLLLGVVGAGFVYLIEKVTHLRTAHPWILLTLPAGGVLIVWLYRICRNREDRGTNMVLSSIRSEAELPIQMAPTIFISTVITHLCGGSAGREGAALQLGGSIGNLVARLFRVRKKDKRLLILSGMSAAFSAIFRTPVAAVIFAMEVGCIGEMRYAALVPCAIASLSASYIANLLGFPLAKYDIGMIPELTPWSALLMVLLGILCAVLSVAFCKLLHRSEHFLQKQIPNDYLRIIIASLLLLLFGLLVQNQDYYGVSEAILHEAIAGNAVWYAFLLKMLFTAVTLAGGFKGGEIVPTFFIGATFGCVFGQLVGLSPSLCAAVGMVALFCGVTNCPLASLFISAELFGLDCVPCCLLVIAVSYLLSGYHGLYKEQKFLYSKFSDAHVRHKTKR